MPHAETFVKRMCFIKFFGFIFTSFNLSFSGINSTNYCIYSLIYHFCTNSDCDLMIFKGNISCYILLLKSPITLENTKFIAGELSLKVSLVLYLPTGHYEP